MFIEGFFLGDGTPGIYKYSTINYRWGLNNSDFSLIERIQRNCKDVWHDIDFKIYDVRKSSHVYKIASRGKKLALEFDIFYTAEKEEFPKIY